MRFRFRNIALFIFLATINSLCLSANSLTPAQNDKGKWGFVDQTGSFIIDPIFDGVVWDFIDEAACVMGKKQMFLIDRKGNVISDKYLWIDLPDEYGLSKICAKGTVDKDGNIADGAYGYISNDGKEIIKPVYEYISPFNTLGLAIVNNGGKINNQGFPEGGLFGYIDRNGEDVIPAKFDFIGEFDENGLCWVNNGGKKFTGDKDVDAQVSAYAKREKDPVKIARKKDALEEKVTGGKRDPFSQKIKGGLYGLFDKQGNMIAKVQYERIGDFAEGMCRVLGKNGYGYIDISGREIIPCQYKDAAPAFKGGCTWVQQIIKKVPRYGYLNVSGKELSPCIYLSASDFSNGYAVVSSDKDENGTILDKVKYGLLDKTGKCVTKMKYDGIIARTEGYFLCKENRKNCLLNKRAEEITPAVITEAKPFEEGYAIIRISSEDAASVSIGKSLRKNGDSKENQVWILINSNGIAASEPYSRILPATNGLYAVEKSGKWGFIDNSGTEVITPQYAWAAPFCPDLAPIKNNDGKYGAIDKSGAEVIPAIYDEVFTKSEANVIPVKLTGKWGGLTTTGQQVIPFNLTSPSDILEIARTIYIEKGGAPVTEREEKIFHARKKGFKSRFSIKSIIDNEYWDY